MFTKNVNIRNIFKFAVESHNENYMKVQDNLVGKIDLRDEAIIRTIIEK